MPRLTYCPVVEGQEKGTAKSVFPILLQHGQAAHLVGIIESDCAYRSNRLERRGQPQEEVRRSFVSSEICQSATFRAEKERHEKWLALFMRPDETKIVETAAIPSSIHHNTEGSHGSLVKNERPLTHRFRFPKGNLVRA